MWLISLEPSASWVFTRHTVNCQELYRLTDREGWLQNLKHDAHFKFPGETDGDESG